MTYLDAVKLGQEAFYNGHPKVFPGERNATDTVVLAWHEGWFDAWRRNALGQFTLIQGGKQ